MLNDSRRGTASGDPMAEEYLAVVTEALRGRLPDGAQRVDLYRANETVCVRVGCDRAKMGVDGVERRLPRSFVWAAPERQIELLREATDNLARDVEATAKMAEVGRAEAMKAQALLYGPGAMAKVAEAQADIDRRAKAMGQGGAIFVGPCACGRDLATSGFIGRNGPQCGCGARLATVAPPAVIDRPSVDEPLPGCNCGLVGACELHGTRTYVSQGGLPGVGLKPGGTVTEDRRIDSGCPIVLNLDTWRLAPGCEAPTLADDAVPVVCTVPGYNGVARLPEAKADPYVQHRIDRLNEASRPVDCDPFDQAKTLPEANARARFALGLAREQKAMAEERLAKLEAALAECGDREAS